jgi:hypothetical protein
MDECCTHRAGGAVTAHCDRRAVWVIRWSEQLADGWTQTTERAYCSTHADEQRARLGERGVRFKVETAATWPAPLRGAIA